MCALRRALMARKRATRAQLSHATGLSAMTVGNLLREMERRGEVAQDETARAGGGRPSRIARYRADYAHFAAVTVEQRAGESAFSLCVYDALGGTAYREAMSLPQVHADSFDGFFARAQATGCRLWLAVFVLPGVAEGDEMRTCDLQELADGQVLRRIREKFGIDVMFENDVNAAVLGHAAAQEGVTAGIYFPRTYLPGAGAVVDGRILRGHCCFAGEVHYIQGSERWTALDYADAAQAAAMIGALVTMYACILAPRDVVLYGDFFTKPLLEAIDAHVRARLMGRFAPALHACRTMTPDMERGAMALGMRRMGALLDAQDG